MLSTTWCYEFSGITETYEIQSMEKNQFFISFPVIVKNDKGSELTLTATVTFLYPPKDFPDHAMVLKRELTGRGSRQYKTKGLRAIYNKLKRYNIPYVFSTTEQTYKGVIQTEDGYRPYIFNPSDHDMKLVAIEKNFRQKIKIHYLESNGSYYRTVANPLVDVTTDGLKEAEKKVNMAMNTNQYVMGDERLLLARYPVGLFKEYAPIYYFGKQLTFTKQYSPASYRQEIILPIEQNSSGYKDFKRFLYGHRQHQEEIEKRIEIVDSTLLGEELPMFFPGERVRVSKPIDKRQPILHFEGVVVKNVIAKVQVEFFGYFKENFEPEELEKLQ